MARVLRVDIASLDLHGRDALGLDALQWADVERRSAAVVSLHVRRRVAVRTYVVSGGVTIKETDPNKWVFRKAMIKNKNGRKHSVPNTATLLIFDRSNGRTFFGFVSSTMLSRAACALERAEWQTAGRGWSDVAMRT